MHACWLGMNSLGFVVEVRTLAGSSSQGSTEPGELGFVSRLAIPQVLSRRLGAASASDTLGSIENRIGYGRTARARPASTAACGSSRWPGDLRWQRPPATRYDVLPRVRPALSRLPTGRLSAAQGLHSRWLATSGRRLQAPAGCRFPVAPNGIRLYRCRGFLKCGV